ncbi:MAG: UDP-3-O-(3-hydroxymyristoyl)glucosamine N-acyltransferase [Saprospiraceae bacterium]|nr:UDP-3-O-(3-hydroxymyristoyl)glucosamine N-acyltransferase [Saprospiraceae bacterium]MCB0623692.1 UDP-3-O-(3-hydroxymyristoyl)glucosamine N-acyltransferase [Saprospiraceae bacterium]MCB0684199.1 UDP-3-O-(3-hydroxymyristoyl)glucosamine N-acyltransferase [Saprospiraceae bacterium]
MQITARQIAELVGGVVEGDPEVIVERPSKIEEGRSGTISFLANPKYESFLYESEASAVLVDRDFVAARRVRPTLIRVPDVYTAVAQLLEAFDPYREGSGGVSDLAFVHPEAIVESGVSIGPFCVVEKGARIGAGARLQAQVFVGAEVEVGPKAVLHPGVRVYPGCRIGARCILHANAVIGSDGFGFAPQPDGSFRKVAQIGSVEIDDDVEIGANTTIDRATMGATRIGKGVKLDNLIHVAHNVEIGANTVIAAQAGIAGSTRIGAGVQVGGQAGFVGHIQVADGARIQAQSGVARSIREPDAAVYGSPAIAYNDYLRSYAVFKKLPELQRRILELERKLAER